jgi:hypothetical protein
MKLRNYVYMNQAGSEGAPAGGGAPAPAPSPSPTPAPSPSPAPAPSPTPSPAPSPAPAPTGKWAETWRQDLAGGNADHMKTLERFTTPQDLWNSYSALRQKMSSGELKESTPFPDKGTPEEQTVWRKNNNIPEAADKYQLKLKDGVVVGEADKPVIDSFLKFVHGKNLSNEGASAAVDWYFDHQQSVVEARSEQDGQAKQKTEDTLRNEWGPEYRTNVNHIMGLLDTAPQSIKDRFLNGRLADGTPIGSDPDMLKFLVGISRQINPVTTVVPGAGANAPSAIADEIKSIEDTMRTNRSKYNADTKMQERYRELLTARSKLGGKAA